MLTGKTAGGFTFHQPLAVRIAAAVPLAADLKVDGDLSAWSSAPELKLTDSNHKTVGTVRFAWRPGGLAMAASITGSAVQAPAGIANLEIATDLDPSKVERSTGDVYNDKLARRRFQILQFSDGKDGAQANRVFSFDGDRLHTGIVPYWMISVRIDHAVGQTWYEAFIPFKEMAGDGPLDAGALIGISAALNVPASDDPGVGVANDQHQSVTIASAGTLFGGISPTPDSSMLGNMLLEPPAQANPQPSVRR